MKAMSACWCLSRAQRPWVKNCKNNWDVFSVGRRHLVSDPGLLLNTGLTAVSTCTSYWQIHEPFLCQTQETQCSICRHGGTRQVIQAAAEPCSQTGEFRNESEHLGLPIWECVLSHKHGGWGGIYPSIPGKRSEPVISPWKPLWRKLTLPWPKPSQSHKSKILKHASVIL